MRGIIFRMLITTFGLWLASTLVAGFSINGPLTLFIAALLLGVVNALVRPIAVILTLPITILTLGLFLLVVNAAMLGLVAALLPGFSISGLFAGIGGWIIVSLTSWLASSFIGPKGRFQVIVVRR